MINRIQAACPQRQSDVFLTTDIRKTTVQHYVRSVDSATLYRKQTVQTQKPQNRNWY